MDHDRVIKHIQAAAKHRRLDCSDNRTFTNQGTMLFTPAKTFVPVIAVTWYAHDTWAAFAYFVGPWISRASPAGIGCKPDVAHRQECFGLLSTDEAISNLLTYIRLAKACKIDKIPKGYMHLSWTPEQCRAQHADPSPYKKGKK
jgi:hypothetical protein